MSAPKKPAALPFFGDAYLADTTHLSTEEHGAYFLLLLAAWRQPDCSLPDDDRKLARIAGLTPRKWQSIKPTIMEFWTVENGRMFQTRLRRERAWVDQKSEQNRQAALARHGAQPTENKQGGGMQTQCERNAPPPPPIVEKEDKSSSSTDARAREPVRNDRSPSFWRNVPEWVPLEPWQRFLKMRRDKRKAVNDGTAALLIDELAKLRAQGHAPGAVLDQSTLNSWTGLFPIDPPKDQANDRQSSPASRFPQRGASTRSLAEDVAAELSRASGTR